MESRYSHNYYFYLRRVALFALFIQGSTNVVFESF